MDLMVLETGNDGYMTWLFNHHVDIHDAIINNGGIKNESTSNHEDMKKCTKRVKTCG